MKFCLIIFLKVNIMISLPYLVHIKSFYNILLHISFKYDLVTYFFKSNMKKCFLPWGEDVLNNKSR
jgi:hypothetical protein